MTALVLDAGAFVAYQRDDRQTVARLRVAERRGVELRSNAVVVAQVWRDSRGRQAGLARLLRGVDVRDVDEQLGRRAGILLGNTGTTDVVDATLVLVSEAGDRVVTSDPRDIQRLADAVPQPVEVIPC